MRSGKPGLIAVVDSGSSGVSGDKFLGALLGLGASVATLARVGEAVENALPDVEKVEVSASDTERGDIGAKIVRVEAKEKVSNRNAGVVKDAVLQTAAELSLSDWGRTFVVGVIDTLVRAESTVHGHPAQETILHELGSADTIVDILGTAAMVEELSLDDAMWVSTPLAVGGGVLRFSGRTYPNPAPAVIEVVRAHRFPIRQADEQTELTTPTGAAITVNLARHAVDSYPAMVPKLIGYGAGSKELLGTANVLRVTVGESSASGHDHDSMVILETNIDDATGEIIGHAVESLFSAGARDVTVTPVYMKKNRPGNMITIIGDASKAEKLASVLMEETGTLGVREIAVRRHLENREMGEGRIILGGKEYTFRVKQAHSSDGRIVRQKPEYDDLKKIAEQSGVSLRKVMMHVEVELSKGV